MAGWEGGFIEDATAIDQNAVSKGSETQIQGENSWECIRGAYCRRSFASKKCGSPSSKGVLMVRPG